MKIKIIIIFGTRPEAIKMAPVIKELQKNPDIFKVTICVTAQHREMLDQVMEIFNISPDVDLNIMQNNQTLASLSAKVMELVSKTLSRIKPDLVLVQGDTTTAMVASLAAFYHRITIGHIEAGLRTNDIYNPFPEEVNRRLISTLSSLNFAPTKTALTALISEGIAKEKLFLTGNTIVDAILMIAKNLDGSNKKYLPPNKNKLILVTAHRRENFGKPLKNICLALKQIIRDNPETEIIYPVHLNPNVHNAVYKELRNTKRIKLIPPVNYAELIYLLSHCYLVLTDSGGIQEEAPTFAKPVLVMRKTTERPEGIEAGVAKLVGVEKEQIVNEVNILLNSDMAYRKMSKAVNPYGDGKASHRIAGIIKNYFRNKK